MSFPLKSNDPYIKPTGERSTLGAQLGSGSGPTIPTPEEGDTGKVLTVGEDGTLEWDNAGGAGGVYVGTDDPTSDIGSNGDYYYKRNTVKAWTNSTNFTVNTTQAGYGNEIAIVSDCTITHISALVQTNTTGSLIIGTTSEALQTIENVSFTAGEWTEVELPTHIQATANDHYIIKVVATASSLKVSQPASGGIAYDDNIATYVKAYYSTTYPGSVENNTYAPTSFKIQTPYMVVDKQYYKSSGSWVEIG